MTEPHDKLVWLHKYVDMADMEEVCEEINSLIRDELLGLIGEDEFGYTNNANRDGASAYQEIRNKLRAELRSAVNKKYPK